jgi:predicted transposase/invertase (TIGR01784 family)
LEEEDSYINEYELRNNKNNSFTNLLKVVILELPKLPEKEDGGLWRWLRFLKCRKKEEYDMLKLKYPELEKPIFCAKKMSFSEKWRDIHFHKGLWISDEKALLKQMQIDGKKEGRTEGLAEGRAEGLAEGRADEKLNIARNALAKGLAPEIVRDITGLSLDEIENCGRAD